MHFCVKFHWNFPIQSEVRSGVGGYIASPMRNHGSKKPMPNRVNPILIIYKTMKVRKQPTELFWGKKLFWNWRVLKKKLKAKISEMKLFWHKKVWKAWMHLYIETCQTKLLLHPKVNDYPIKNKHYLLKKLTIYIFQCNSLFWNWNFEIIMLLANITFQF